MAASASKKFLDFETLADVDGPVYTDEPVALPCLDDREDDDG